MMFATLLDTFEQRYADRVEPDHLELARRTLTRLPALSIDQPDTWTVQHGDYRLDNLLFGAGDGAAPIAVVDWQTVLHGPGVSDLSYFIGAGLTTEDRRTHERALVDEYRGRMAADGVELDPDWLWLQYRQHSLDGLAMAVGAAVMVAQTDRGDDMFLTMVRRHSAHGLDLEVESVLPPPL
jgi:aminoglycoside phosphotransferase (APT) family kinase protein